DANRRSGVSSWTNGEALQPSFLPLLLLSCAREEVGEGSHCGKGRDYLDAGWRVWTWQTKKSVHDRNQATEQIFPIFSHPMTTQLSHPSQAASRPTPALWPLIAGMLFLASCTTPSGTGKREADFTHYDEPLYEQMTNRIKAKVMARLGEGKNTQDRYFIIPYAYQNKGNDPAFSHSFISVIRVYADGTAPKPISGLQEGESH